MDLGTHLGEPFTELEAHVREPLTELGAHVGESRFESLVRLVESLVRLVESVVRLVESLVRSANLVPDLDQDLYGQVVRQRQQAASQQDRCRG